MAAFNKNCFKTWDTQGTIPNLPHYQKKIYVDNEPNFMAYKYLFTQD